MSLRMKTYVYVASPIDATAQFAGMGRIRGETLGAMESVGLPFYDPYAAFGGPGAPVSATLVNETALLGADGMIALLPDGIPSIGTPIEIARFALSGRPLFVVSNVNSTTLKTLNCRQFPEHEYKKAVGEMVNALLARAASGELVSAKSDLNPALRALKVTGPGRTPERAYSGDAGFDLFAYLPRGPMVIPPGNRSLVPTGISVQFPDELYGVIMGRSGLIRQRGLVGVFTPIDTGFRGELFAMVFNFSTGSQTIEDGDKVAQLVLHRNEALGVEAVRVEALDPSDRGTNGFGSTGT